VLNRLYARSEDAMVAEAQFAAAGMARTRYGDSRDVIVGKGPDYRFTRASPDAAGILEQVHPVSLPFHRASNGLVSTAEDMASWIIALEQGRLLRAGSVDTMWTPVAFNNGTMGQWGMGWTILPRGNGHRAVGMTGGGRSAFFIYPEDRVAVVILTNLSGSYPEDAIDGIAAAWAPALRLTGVPALRVALEERGYDAAQAAAADLSLRDPALRWNEAELNDWGYRLLSSGRPREALAVLQLTATLFPASGNAQDSLAEAFAVNGRAADAIVHYRRSLELDPGNDNARRRLQRLEAPAS
jgi:CubicO group peptidase (beta-lactamase class C family)